MNNCSLEFLKQLARAIAKQFGPSCEIVIHDLEHEKLENCVVYIENGHVTNRSIGAGPSRVVLETLSKDASAIEDHLGYLTKADDGKILKSSTIYIRSEEDNAILYILSINYDITGLLAFQNALKALTDTDTPADKSPEKITRNVNDLLDDLIEQSVALIGKPAPMMTKDERVCAIQFLKNAGAFLITKSGDKVANYFGISKFTLYSYIDLNK